MDGVAMGAGFIAVDETAAVDEDHQRRGPVGLGQPEIQHIPLVWLVRHVGMSQFPISVPRPCHPCLSEFRSGFFCSTDGKTGARLIFPGDRFPKKSAQPIDWTGICLPPLSRDGKLFFPGPTNRPQSRPNDRFIDPPSAAKTKRADAP
jgi:hypothetical protein